MTNDSVDDNDVIVGIIDAHRARHVVVARRVEGANMVMKDERCRDVTTTSTGTGTWTRTSGIHTHSLYLVQSIVTVLLL